MLAGLILSTVAAAQDAPPAKPAAEAGILRLLPETSTTRHTMTVGGRSLDYTATAGGLPLRDDKGETTAEIFHVAYMVEPASPERPVTFVFNGGPGAASAFLHLGAMGPRAIAFAPSGALLPPPARLIDNPDTWLDITDLVFVDPVGTGYSRAGKPGEDGERPFLGVRQDADAIAAFIRLYLARAGRTQSPVFLAGESYGGFRAAVLAKTLQERSGIAPSGAILISPALEFSLLRGDPSFALLPWALSLPSFAAVHFEKQGVTDPEMLASRLHEVERFALTDYLVYLAAGRLAGSAEVNASLAAYTGLPPELIARQHGRISASRFIKEYDRANGRVLSRYDGSVSGPDPNPGNPQPSGPDPVLDPAVPVWTTAFVAYVRDALNYRTDLTYRLLNRDISGRWDYGTSPTHQGFAGSLDELQAARTMNPALQVLVVHGYSDLVTTYFASRYLIDQLPPLAGVAPIELRVYGGGHMFYTRPESRRALRRDARAVYERALAAARVHQP